MVLPRLDWTATSPSSFFSATSPLGALPFQFQEAVTSSASACETVDVNGKGTRCVKQKSDEDRYTSARFGTLNNHRANAFVL